MAILTKTQKYAAETYARYFGKTADAATLADYVSIGKTSKILKQIIEDADIEQYNVHGNDLQAEVHNEFQNLFSRNATNKELEKYVKVLQKGKNLPINSIVKKASKFDKDVYRNKQEIAKFVAENGGGVVDLSKVTKANPIDVKSLTSLTDLQAKIAALPENDFVPTVFDGQSYNLTDGLDNLPGTNKNDIFTGSNSATDKLNTANGVDILDGKAGIDTLKISTDGTAVTPIEIPNITNIEIIEVTSTKGVDVDTTSTTGVTDLKVVKASDDVDATAGSETNITVSGVTSGDITTEGGKDVTVTDTASTNANVSAITVGTGVNTPTGNVKITTNLNSDGTATLTGGAIGVTGGKTVDVTVNSTITAKDATATSNIANGNVTVNSDGKTTTVSVKQNSKVTPFKTPAVDAVEGTSTVTFKDLAQGKSVTIDSLVFTASKDLTAAQVAQAFANLTTLDTQSSTGITENGIYSGALATANLVSGKAVGATVVFTNGTATAPVITPTTSGTALDAPVTVNGTAATPAGDTSTAGNTVTYGAVTIDDDATASIKTITVDGYGASTIGATGNVDALTDLTLKNSDGTMTVTTAATSLNLTVDNINDAVTLAAPTLTTLNLTTTGEDSIFALTAAAVTSLTVAANANLDISSAPLAALVTANITGTGAVALGDVSAALVTLSASAAKGAISAEVDGTKATVTTGSGDDSIIVNTATGAVTNAITLGAGDDRLDLSALTAANVSTIAAISGGADTDIVVLDGTEALDTDLSLVANSTIFKSKVTGFEKLEIVNNLTASGAVNVGNLGYNYVITNAIASNVLTLDNMANNGTVELNDAAATTEDVVVLVKDAATNNADVLNVVLKTTSSTENAGTLTVANVETINISTVELDSTNLDSATELNLAATSVKTVTVKGDADLELDTGATTHANLKTVDASAMTGALTYEINSSVVKFALTSGKGDDTITVSTSDDAQVKTGLGADTIYIESGAVSANIWGGAGNDIFDVTDAISSATQYVTIEDATSGDQIILDTDNFLSGDITITDFDKMTLTDKFKAVLENTTLNTANSTGFAISFQEAGNTYIVVSDGNGTIDFGAAGTDQVIKLTGLKDLSAGASFNVDGTLEIA